MQPQLHISRKGEVPFTSVPPVVNGTETNKPFGGLWTSTYTGLEYGSAWVQSCYAMDFIIPEDRVPSWLLTVDDNARIYTIDSVPDMYYIWDRYGYKLTDTVDAIDFEKMANDYDALYLTEHGQEATRHYELNRPIMQSMYGWDCESTLWFRWVFTEVTYLGEICYDSQYND